MTRVLTFIFLTAYIATIAQGDSTQSDYGYYKWTKRRAAVRIATGFQKSMSYELGISGLNVIHNGYFWAISNLYSAVEFSPTGNVWGFKGGFEFCPIFLAFGFEGKYQTNSTTHDFLVTPKVGLSGFGQVNIYYGYNFTTNDRPFEKIGRHQLSINLNINKYYIKSLR